MSKNSVLLIATYIATSILNYAFGVALSWFFTPAQYGVLGVAQSLLLLIALVVGSSFTWTTAHDVASAGITPETMKRFRTGLLANGLLGITVSLGLWAFYGLGLIPLGPAYRLVVPLVALTTMLLSFRSVVNGTVRGMYRFGSLSANLVGEVLIKSVFGLGLVALGWGANGVLIGFAIGAAVSLVHSLWLVRGTSWWRGTGWFDRSVIRATLPLFAGMMGTALMLNLDVLGLKLFAPAGQGDTMAGLYQAAVILARTPVFIAQALTLVLFSYAAGDKEGHKNQRLLNYLGSAFRSWTRLLLPGGLVLILAPEAVLSLFFPERYHSAAGSLQIAAFGGVLLALLTLLIGVLQAGGKRKQGALSVAIGALTQIAVLAFYVPRLGVTAAALSLVAGSAVSLILLAPALIRIWVENQAQFSIRKLAETGIRVVLPLTALALPLALLPDGSRWMSLLKLGLAGFGYLASLAALHTPAQARPTKRPVLAKLTHFVQVLIGG